MICSSLRWVLLIVFTMGSIGEPGLGQAGQVRSEPGRQGSGEFSDVLEGGASAFKAGDFEGAVRHFQRAIALDPASTVALRYLGAARASQVVPNLDTPENLAMAAAALEAFRQIPPDAPEYLPALRQMASVERDTKRLDEARKTELNVLRLDAKDAEAHYTIGVMDWMAAYKTATTALAGAGMSDAGDGNPKLASAPCRLLMDKNGAVVQDGLEHLRQAIALRPAYDDAMQYMNLMYRRQADLACGDERARLEALSEAAMWSQKAMDARRRNEAERVPQPVAH